MENDIKKDLLVIGNGFDLKCKLETRFSDYFDSLGNDEIFTNLKNIESSNSFSLVILNKLTNKINIEMYRKNFKKGRDLFIDGERKRMFSDALRIFDEYEKINSISNNLLEDKLSFFDLYFKYIKVDNIGKNWSDVEQRISDLITNGTFNRVYNLIDKIKESKQYIINEETPGELSEDAPEDEFIAQVSDFDKLIDMSVHKDIQLLCVFFLINIFEYQIESHTPNYFINFMVNQLNKFEDNLGKYIEKKSERNDYLVNSQNLLKSFGIANNYNVLNFNYTDPFSSKDRHVETVSNIHGNTDNPIVGVDASIIEKANNNNESLIFNQFTKTYQIMSNTEKHKKVLPNLKSIDTIYFYGHSLAEADYSYFQSIFDYYDLYGSQINLVFYYSVYNSNKKEQIVNQNINNVWNLINEYGESMENAKGKNLLHKLNLENRIKIKAV
ncbi:bacteriophage abortive infection AbiH family protein [Fructilactobacillus myrtifloralis]|uniref:Bacteriophage abortive infection AbiH family protein n=1 Tax=Fructilactobacillus myrtifloralis TaxID=2940301 RepID=A0ABY5BQ13_9LACO|nr:AbiH family protein [Fructilactobacillus myrtifloralis]USS85742.1 bacteriophage abortive infection AbiH family protein [Fructilactobacillus myrtifloralis]